MTLLFTQTPCPYYYVTKDVHLFRSSDLLTYELYSSLHSIVKPSTVLSINDFDNHVNSTGPSLCSWTV